ncbi:hypothetical protein Lfu02_26250 [Longispora fulva]|nr:hypothetical protein Lfu02_26250 [Longispora fulva]
MRGVDAELDAARVAAEPAQGEEWTHDLRLALGPGRGPRCPQARARPPGYPQGNPRYPQEIRYCGPKTDKGAA